MDMGLETMLFTPILRTLILRKLTLYFPYVHAGLSQNGVQRQYEEKASVLNVRTAVAGILVDESFSIPTEEIKKCLSIAQSLMKYFNCDQVMPTCEAFCSWLVDALEEIVGQSKKQSGVINAEKLWNSYHRLTTSQVFKTNWEVFRNL